MSTFFPGLLQHIQNVEILLNRGVVSRCPQVLLKLVSETHIDVGESILDEFNLGRLD